MAEEPRKPSAFEINLIKALGFDPTGDTEEIDLILNLASMVSPRGRAAKVISRMAGKLIKAARKVKPKQLKFEGAFKEKPLELIEGGIREPRGPLSQIGLRNVARRQDLLGREKTETVDFQKQIFKTRSRLEETEAQKFEGAFKKQQRGAGKTVPGEKIKVKGILREGDLDLTGFRIGELAEVIDPEGNSYRVVYDGFIDAPSEGPPDASTFVRVLRQDTGKWEKLHWTQLQKLEKP